MDRFVELETFVAVVETGSLSGAAERLGVSVSAVSRRLGELESRLGVRLANRSTRGLAPTASGVEYHGRAVALLAALQRADESVTGAGAAMEGTLRIAVPLSYGLAVVAPVLHAFAAERPALRLDVDYSDRRVDLVEEGFDLAIRIGELSDSRLVARRLTDIVHVLAASPDFWERRGRPVTPDELEGVDALCYRERGARARWTWTTADGPEAGMSGSVEVRPRYMATNGEALAAAAVAGLGVTREPDFIVRGAIDAGRLEPVLTDYLWSPMTVWIVFPQGRPLAPRARDLVERLVVEVGGEGGRR